VRILLPLPIALVLVACNGGKSDTALADTAAAAEQEPIVNDSDGDGILDIHETDDDFDGDGQPNYLDEDSDDDGIPDSVEAGDDDPETYPIDSDGDGAPDYLDIDSDDNGLNDVDEAGDHDDPIDTDGDGDVDYRDDDNDGDGISDEWEMDFQPALPPDTDFDGRADYMDTDSDGDSLCDIWEGGTTAYREEPVDSDEDGTYDYRDEDSDDDGFLDSEEAGVTTSCAEPEDADGDGSWNSADTDADGDGLSDVDEVNSYGTDPYDDDSDGDGQSDGAEVFSGTDPLDESDSIEGLYIEVGERTSQEATFTFDLGIQYGDVAFLLDTTGSMSSTAQTTAQRFSEVVTELSDTFENLAFGLAQFDDYNYGSMGSGADKPFILLQQLTTNESDMQTALNAIALHSGGDGQESTVEALYQAITGEGYDQSCNGSYDSADDVPPFIASGSDPFNGGGGQAYDSSIEGTGERGGFGFRPYSLAIIVYATDYYIRDADSADSTLSATPGGCPQDAGHLGMYEALEELGGYLVGVDVGTSGPTSAYAPSAQMEEFAYATNSVADLDDDGDADDPLVFWASQGSSTFADEFKETIVKAVDQLVAAVDFDTVELIITGDEYGLIQSVSPEYYTDIDEDDFGNLDFEIEFLGTIAATEDDQLFSMTLQVIGNETILLDEKEIVVVVPGTSY